MAVKIAGLIKKPVLLSEVEGLTSAGLALASWAFFRFRFWTDPRNEVDRCREWWNQCSGEASATGGQQSWPGFSDTVVSLRAGGISAQGGEAGVCDDGLLAGCLPPPRRRSPATADQGRHLSELRGFGASLAAQADDGTGDRGGRVTQTLPGSVRHRLEAVHTDVWGRKGSGGGARVKRGPSDGGSRGGRIADGWDASHRKGDNSLSRDEGGADE